LVAVELKVYVSPLVSPLTVHEPEAPVTVQVWEPLAAVVVSVAVTRYEAGAPPVVGGLTVTVAWPGPATALGATGAPGGTWGVTGAEGPEEAEVPPALVAVELKVYVSPLVSPLTVHEPEAPVTVQV
jgi:hypothetical protein